MKFECLASSNNSSDIIYLDRRYVAENGERDVKQLDLWKQDVDQDEEQLNGEDVSFELQRDLDVVIG